MSTPAPASIGPVSPQAPLGGPAAEPPRRPYTRPMPLAWWMRQRAYQLFVIRELTSVFIGGYALVLLFLLRSLTAGPEAYQAYLRFLASPGMVFFHVVALAAALFHSITWFRLAPLSMDARVGGRPIADSTLVAANYAAWALASVLIAWIVLR